jgi:hypothetical protein
MLAVSCCAPCLPCASCCYADHAPGLVSGDWELQLLVPLVPGQMHEKHSSSCRWASCIMYLAVGAASGVGA